MTNTPTSRTAQAMRLCVAITAVGAVMPAAAGAHGGFTLAEGSSGGVDIAVQGSPAGAGEVDLATSLVGSGSGEGSRVVYWIRPVGRTTAIRVTTQRDDTGTHHTGLPTAGRGDWQDWDISAYVTLTTGEQLRVTNDRQDPPGPSEQLAAQEQDKTLARTQTPTRTPTTQQAVVEDVSGKSDGTPGWVVPSLLGVVLVSAALVASHRRGRS